jgi:glycosyltransferase involved in cell wall biosynthesis
MIRLFINGLAASAGGGLTYLRNVIPHLAQRDDVHTTVLLNSALRREFNEAANISLIEIPASDGALRRLMREQTEIPGLLRRSNAHVLISAGNFALWNSPVPQILLSRNSLYTSADFARDVRLRGDYAIWMDTLVKGWLARESIRRAEVTVAPSAAFARELTEWSGREVVSIHHGFDAESFASRAAPLSAAVQAQLEQGRDAVRLLFVSHYNYYRNFETLFRAMPILSRRLKGKRVKLYLTCRLSSSDNPGSYRPEAASGLLRDLRNNNLRNNDLRNNDLRNKCEIVELGSVPYRSLHHLYRACHIYVSPAYAESFAHPLVEAMSSGLPVVAADLAVHREICGNAAIYFSRFSPEELADRVRQICDSHELAANLSNNGLHRSQDFSWHRHVSRLLELAENLIRTRAEKHS